MLDNGTVRARRKKGHEGSDLTRFDPVYLCSGVVVGFLVPSFYFLIVAHQAIHGLTLSSMPERFLFGQSNVITPVANQRPMNPYESKFGKNHTVTIEDVVEVFSRFLSDLHDKWARRHEGVSTYHDIWYDYHDLAAEQLLPFDEFYLEHMPTRRDDDSIFVSMASYRDENCMETLEQAYAMSAHPEKLNVGLVQQNCNHDCMSGVLENGKTEPVPPDPDCYAIFCATALGQSHCDEGRVRVLRVEETESTGPFVARYFASKLWTGESWILQIDSHMSFAEHWDAQSIIMLKSAPSEKPIITHYPPAVGFDFKKNAKKPTDRICGPAFASTSIESQIVRLEGLASDKDFRMIPRFAPFVAAGYFVAHSRILREAPFDPLMPWVFMGEEIIMSSRFWTHGYDIFSPTHAVVAHRYVRRHKPKYWETVGRLFWDGIDTPLGDLVINRVKYQLGYPESARDMVKTKSIYTSVEKYSMGKVRTIEEYMKSVGLNAFTKEVTITHWCETGQPPEYAKHLAHHYN